MKLYWSKTLLTLGPSLLQGIGVVIYVTLFGFLSSLIIGLLLAIGRMSKNKILNRILVLFVELIRGTPLLVQFFYIYYVVPMLLDAFFLLFGMETGIQIKPVAAGIIGFGINYGCYMSEVIRSAIMSIDQGQREAGLALGYSEGQVFYPGIWKLSCYDGKGHFPSGNDFRTGTSASHKNIRIADVSDGRGLYPACTRISGDIGSALKSFCNPGEKTEAYALEKGL